MFETALYESSGALKNRSRGAAIASALLQAALLAAILLAPLLYTASLSPRTMDSHLLAAPRTPAAPAGRAVAITHAVPGSSHAFTYSPVRRPATDNSDPATPSESVGDVTQLADISGIPGNLPGGVPTLTPHASVARAANLPASPLRISSGVLDGRRIGGDAPVYPAIAKSAGVYGKVVIAATVLKTGTVVDAQLVSGNSLLAQAALAAVRTYRYQPYLLNGTPVAVQTTIEVQFVLRQ